MYAKPNYTETTSSKESHSFEVLGEAITELAILVGSEIVPYIEAAFLTILLMNIDGLFLGVLIMTRWLSFVGTAFFVSASLLVRRALVMPLVVGALLTAFFLAPPIEQLF